MKNYIVLMITAIVLSNKTFAQFKKDTLVLKKNELSMDLIPIIKIFSDVEQAYNYKGTMKYKRQINKHLFFRFGFTLIKKHQARKYSDPFIVYIDSIHDGVSFNSYEHKPEIQFNTGLEYRWGKKRLKHFTGIDIGYSYSEIIYKRYYGLTQKYSNFNPNNTPLYTELSNNKNNFQENVIYSNVNIKNAICLTPFYGIQYHFSKQFFFSMQLSIQLQYRPDYKRTSVAEPYSILNDFSLAYRF